MKLLDIITSPWLILPEKLVEIQEIYITHLRGEKIDLNVVEAQLGRPLDNRQKPYEVENGVAIINIEGVIGKRMNAFSKISGGASTQLIGQDFRAAKADDTVKTILLYIDSPGGTADGVQELAHEIYEARGQKPIIAYTDGVMASAAYWIGSAADKIFISGETAEVGSIGVVARHIDVSEADKARGIKRTNIVAGKYKRIADDTAPLSESGRQYLQEAVDHLYSIFTNDVSKFRGLSAEPVPPLAGQGKEESIPWADGRLFFGKQALANGLVDGVSTMAKLITKYGSDQAEAVRAMVAERIQEVLHATGNIINP